MGLNGPDYEGAIQYSFGRLERELSPFLIYHSYWHTRGEVLPAAIRLARMAGIEGERLMLLRTGVAFHDIGFIEGRTDHEALAIQLARQVLPEYGFKPAQVEVVCGLIQATRLPQTPYNLLEEIITDADLDSLGAESFLLRSEDLRVELAAFGQVIPSLEWFSSQIQFFRSHHYFTEYARSLRQARKEENIAILENILAGLRRSVQFEMDGLQEK